MKFGFYFTFPINSNNNNNNNNNSVYPVIRELSFRVHITFVNSRICGIWFCQNNRGCHVATISTVQNLVSLIPRNWRTVYNLIVSIGGCVS
jgi:hypothetical protein